MNAPSIIILAIVLGIAFLCVRSIIIANKKGECGTCALEDTCTVNDTGKCALSEDMMARADAAVAKYEASKRDKAA